MQRKLQAFIMRACGIAVLAPLGSAAWAGPGADVPDHAVAARDTARALFRPENAIAAQAGRQDGSLASAFRSSPVPGRM